MKSPPRSRRRKPISLALVSGGLDSTVAALVARRERPGRPLALLHLDYGQKARSRERRAFRKIAAFLQAEHVLISELRHLKHIGGSSLTDSHRPVPSHAPRPGSTPTTYVPFRNANLLAAAAAWAESIGADRIYLGISEPDSRHYPDTRASFLRAFQQAVGLGTKPSTTITLRAPLIRLSKSEIVRLGHRLGVPFHLTWSCYRGGLSPCNRCASCRLRRRGFAEAGIPDSIFPDRPVRKKPLAGRGRSGSKRPDLKGSPG